MCTAVATNKLTTEYCGRVVSIPASYSGGPRLKFRPADWITKFFRGFPWSLQADAMIIQ
jgi:hypothetical protein